MKKSRLVALYGVLVALAFVFSYLETLLPSVGIPGVKLGLANSVVLVTLYLLRPRDALAVSLVRVLLVGLTFGTPVSMIYSLAGGLTAFAVMWLCARSGRFSPVGVSIAGGVSHNIGQMLAASAVIGARLEWYLPVLLVTGAAAGALMGVLCRLLLPPLRRMKM